MRYAHFATLDDFDAFRDPLWVLWHAVRSAELAAQYPERGHVAGGALDWQSSRAPRSRSHLRYGRGHPRAGDPVDPDPGRPGGLVWVTTTAPGCRDECLIAHSDGGDGGVLPILPGLEGVLAAYDGRSVDLPALVELRGVANPRAVAKPRSDHDMAQRLIRTAALREVEERRARLLLGHEVGTPIERTRSVVVARRTAVERAALPARARATLDAYDASTAAGIGISVEQLRDEQRERVGAR